MRLDRRRAFGARSSRGIDGEVGAEIERGTNLLERFENCGDVDQAIDGFRRKTGPNELREVLGNGGGEVYWFTAIFVVVAIGIERIEDDWRPMKERIIDGSTDGKDIGRLCAVLEIDELFGGQKWQIGVRIEAG